MSSVWPAQVPYRSTVDVFCSSQGVHRRCRTVSIGLDGLFVIGSPALRPQADVTVTIHDPHQDDLQIRCKVTAVTLDGVRLGFDNPSPATLERLEALIGPTWNGKDLLEGVLTLANHSDIRDLAGLLRLTTIMEAWRRLIRVRRPGRGASSYAPTPGTRGQQAPIVRTPGSAEHTGMRRVSTADSTYH